MERTNLLAALQYRNKFNFSIFPVGSDKKPLIESWKKYQTQKASEQEIKAWWGKWPEAGIGLVTGRISGICAVDLDKYKPDYNEETVQEIIPDSTVTPTARTPRGGSHLLFAMPEDDVRSKNDLQSGVDLKAEGGYIILPPSKNDSGCYEWIISLDDATPAALPLSIYSFIYKHVDNASFHSRLESSMSSAVVNFYIQGRRDDDLFHAANLLIKAGGEVPFVKKTIEILALSCNPPFHLKEVPAKIESALKRAERRERNLTDEVRDWVLSSNGVFLSSDVVNCLQLSSRDERKHLSKILSRFCEGPDSILERTGKRNGEFRRKQLAVEILDWRNAPTSEFEIDLPLELSTIVKVYPRNPLVFAGAKSAGKTALALDIVKRNMNRCPIIYMTCELGETELRNRLALHNDIGEKEWQFEAITRHENHADLITGEKKVWVIDYIEEIAEPWKVALQIKKIHDKLREGVAVIFLQKNPGTEWARGGAWTIDKARLYVAMERVGKANKARIIDCKAFRGENPRGWTLDYKLLHGTKFLPEGFWRGE